jgi:hypothetical protein
MVVLLGAASACGSSPERSPNQLLSEALTTLARARSVHTGEVQSGAAGSNTYVSDVTQGGFHTEATSSNGARAETVLTDGTLYERSTRTGGSWWIMPTSSAAAAQAGTIPGIVECLRAEHGHLIAGGSLQRRNLLLADDGLAPGAGPGRWYVTTGNPVTLTRFVHHGPDNAGGPAHCGHTLSGVTVDESYSKYNAPVAIVPPGGAVPAPPGTT